MQVNNQKGQSQTVAEKLELLKAIQSIDSTLDEFAKLRGDLPQEVQDLEDEIEGYEVKLERLKNDQMALDEEVKSIKQSIKDSEKSIEKYNEQRMNVRNNREYDAITKEIELHELDIKFSKKKEKEVKARIDEVKASISDLKNKISERTKDLGVKKQELDAILAENLEEEKKLYIQREAVAAKIETRLLDYYNKLRKTLSNGLAVVTVRRNAAEGSNIILPPQRIVEIQEKKKIIFDEYSGRILADVEIYEEPVKPKRTITRTKKAAALPAKEEEEFEPLD
jgi:predicted  nucleic acid-binding Zn-ribbon protein